MGGNRTGRFENRMDQCLKLGSKEVFQSTCKKDYQALYEYDHMSVDGLGFEGQFGASLIEDAEE